MTLVSGITGIAKNIIGKHKIPKYLYHITPTKNLENIKKAGLHMTEDDLYGEGVFMFDMANFLKFWTKKGNKEDYAKELLQYVGRHSTNVSIIRVPTKNLVKKDLSVRRQDKLFNIMNKYDDVDDIYQAYSRKEISTKLMDEISEGEQAIMANKFDRKKVPLEYIYPSDIAAKDIEVIGQTNYDYQKVDVLDIFRNLLKNCKEAMFLGKVI